MANPPWGSWRVGGLRVALYCTQILGPPRNLANDPSHASLDVSMPATQGAIRIKNTMKLSRFFCFHLAMVSLVLPACNVHRKEAVEERHKIVVTSPKSTSVTITQKYVCQIHSRQHIEIRALERGYLEEIQVKEGQTVKRGDVMFKVILSLAMQRQLL